MNNKRIAYGVSAAVAGLLVTWATASMAQESNPSPAVSSAPSVNTGIEEIIVTARRRSELEQDVPIAITAYSMEDLQRYNTQSIADIGQLTPGLIISTAPTQTGGTITLRGIGAGAGNPATDQAVSINVDGIQISQANILRIGQFDQQGVEVLKGPQALFFGKNSPGGIIALHSADPGDTFESSLRTGYEIKNEQKFAEAIVSGPFTDALGARLVFYASSQNGWFRNVAEPVPGLVTGPQQSTYPDYKEYFTRLTLVHGRSDDAFDAKLKLSYDDVKQKDGASAASQTYNCPGGAAQLSANVFSGGMAPAVNPCRLGRDYVEGDSSPNIAALDPLFRNGVPYLESKQYLASLEANLRLSPVLTLSSLTGYYHINEVFSDNDTGSDIDLITAASDLTNEQVTQELRVTSSFAGPVNFMAGGFYEYGALRDHVPVALNFPLLGVPAPPTVAYDPNSLERTDAFSFFGQATYAITNQWELSGGARWSDEIKKLSGTVFGAPFTVERPRISFTNTSPEATLKFKPSVDLTTYISYREGFVSGGYNDSSNTVFTPTSDPSFKPSTVRGGEGGVKGFALNHHLKFEGAIYYYKYKDMQLSTFDPVTTSITTINAGKSTIKGVELAADYSPAIEALKGVLFRAGINYNSARYKEFLADCYEGQTIAQGCNLTPLNGVFQAQNLAGRPLQNAPDWAGEIGASYEYSFAENLWITTSIDGNYSGAFIPLEEESPESRESAYWLLNAGVSLHGRDHDWDVALIGKNLSNTLRNTLLVGVPLTGAGSGTTKGVLPDLAGPVNAPRTILLQFTIKSGLFTH